MCAKQKIIFNGGIGMHKDNIIKLFNKFAYSDMLEFNKALYTPMWILGGWDYKKGGNENEK